MPSTHDQIISLLPFRYGHFRMESGHHSDVWVDLELLCLNPNPIRQLADEIAARLERHHPEMICGPLVEGAFLGLLVASQLDLPFCYAERFAEGRQDELYPVRYRVPGALRTRVQGQRVAIVNDVINAGSAVRGTFADLEHCDARPVAIGSLLVFGDWAPNFAAERKVALENLATLPNKLWTPLDCPLCKQNIPLTE